LVSSKPATNSHALGIAVSATELRIDTVAYGINIAGGSGTVTSAGITSADLTVSNSPITTSGVIDLALNTVPVSKGGTGLTSAVEQGGSLIASSSSAYVAQATSLSWRNRVINGDMRVAQRGTASITLSGVGYPVDRFYVNKSSGWTGLVATTQQSSNAPAGFSNSLITTVVTGNSSASGYSYYITHPIEGTNIADCAYGTASARTMTLSFWVKSSLAGTYSISLAKASINRSFVAEYTISLVNTWEKKVITVPGDTSGTWTTDSGLGLALIFPLRIPDYTTSTLGSWQASQAMMSTASNALNFSGTSGRTFQVTGVQLELGSVATPFELLQYEKQLELCQRYFARLSSLSGSVVGFGAGCYPSDTSAFVYIKYPQAMRSTPTLSVSSVGTFDTLARVTTWSTMYYGNNSMMATGTRTSVASSTGRGCVMTGSTASAYIDLNAEL
jgi:hypothetical protein